MSETNDTGPNVFQRMSKVMEEIGTIGKNGTNSFHNYDYATEADFVQAVQPLLLKHGLVMILQAQDILGASPVIVKGVETGKFLTSIRSTYRIVNVNDPKDYTTVQVGGQGMDNGDKGIYKAITGAKKYALANAFLIATGDDPEKDQLTTRTKKASLKAANDDSEF